MQLDDLKQGWREAVVSHASTDDLTEVIANLEKQTTKIDKEIKRRDLLEISIAVLLIPFWIYGLTNTVGIMQTMGLITAIISCIYIPYKLLNARKVSAVKSSSIKDFLIREKQKVEQQKQLLESIVWWYLAPLTLSIILITLGSTATETSMFTINDYLQKYYFFLALLVVGVYFLNKRAAKKKFTPLLENIEQRLAELKN
ncbi:MAG: hypothetical protein MJK12_03225 [Colwellia sp.]|nr:hypothetical protein [Colwellia sp.]